MAVKKRKQEMEHIRFLSGVPHVHGFPFLWKDVALNRIDVSRLQLELGEVFLLGHHFVWQTKF